MRPSVPIPVCKRCGLLLFEGVGQPQLKTHPTPADCIRAQKGLLAEEKKYIDALHREIKSLERKLRKASNEL